MMLHLEGVLTPAEVMQILQGLAGAPFEPGSNFSASTAAIKHNLQLAARHATAQQLTQIVVAALERSQAFNAAALPVRMTPPLFTHYGPGMGYGDHVDAGVMSHHLGATRSDLSATLFLTPPESYEGGELRIETGMGAALAKYGAGDLVLYPSTAVHRVEPVRAGTRSVIIFWVQSQVRDAHRRRTLFDLDRLAVSLRARVQDPTLERDRTVLSGVYQNLLREWAEL